MDLPFTFSLMRTKSPWFVCDADRKSFSWWTAVYSIISSCSRSSFTLLIISNSSSPTVFSDVTLSFVRRFRDGPYETDDGPFRSCCKWLVITSSNSFRVSGLNIWGNLFNTASGLNGKIPHFANLLFLSYLNLVGCRFTRPRSFVEKEDFGITICFCSSLVRRQSQIIDVTELLEGRKEIELLEGRGCVMWDKFEGTVSIRTNRIDSTSVLLWWHKSKTSLLMWEDKLWPIRTLSFTFLRYGGQTDRNQLAKHESSNHPDFVNVPVPVYLAPSGTPDDYCL